MARLSLLDLPDPPAEYDAAAARDSEGKAWFETDAVSERRDRQRARWLRKFVRGSAHLIDRKQAVRLRRRLRSYKLPDTQASARYMRDVRRRVAGALWGLVNGEREGACHSAFTLIPAGLLVRPEDLRGIRAATLINRLRAQLNRAGAASAKGWLIAALHCDFDPTSKLFQFHYHGIASGETIEVIERLRIQGPYKRARWQPMTRINSRARRPVLRSRKPLTDLPRPLAYIWQGWWPAHARGDGSRAQGTNQRHRRKRRIPEPFHSQALLWLDRERIEDMTLMIGLYVGKSGFVVRTRKQ